MTTTKTFLSSLLLFSLCLQGCSSENEKTEQNVQKTEHKKIQNSNEVILKDTQNKQFTLLKTPEGFQLKSEPKKLLLIDVFATWCPPCQAEASHLSSLAKKYKNDLQVIGITIENGIEDQKIEIFKQTYNASYPVARATKESQELINTLADKLKLGQNFGIPLMALFKDGKLVKFFQGSTEEEFIESEIKKALQESK